MKYLIGIDIGTSGTKSVLFDTDGKVVASALKEYPLYQPKNGWAEQDPADWWNAVCETLAEITKKADGEIAGVGLSGQMHGLVMLDESGEVLRKSIIWCDGRTSEECTLIEDIIGRERFIELNGNPALPGFTASKIMWVKRHEPDVYAKCKHILLPKDYIRYKLTGEFATEVSDASGMQLMDIANRCWSEEICEKLGIDMSLLGKMHESPEVTGYITDEASVLTGLKTGIPVAGGAGDNAAAAIGTGVCSDGKAFTTIGTSGVVFVHTDKMAVDPKGRVHTLCCAVPGAWHVMGCIQAAGLSLNWFRNNLAKDLSYKEIDAAAESVAPGCDGLIYLPYLMGERTPILDTNARGTFFGLSAMHTREHMARAVIEGVSYALYSCLDVLGEMNVKLADMALCGGGAKSKLWQSILADMYMLPVKTPIASEGPALGVAILAGVAAGVYKSVEEGCARTVAFNPEINGDKAMNETYMKYYDLYKSLYPALKDSFAKLNKIR
ncbi:MAG: xylulokinase [Clostridia bacterium]|nr:xylulokinase [Clostridia bacterium]